MNDFLKSLKIKENNFGSCSGPDGWIENSESKIIESFNPSNGQRIASVFEATVDDYNGIIKQSLEAFHEWRKIPAPVRGQLIREMGNALRDYKDQLGSLVSLEMGKIKQEGDGEVQEMIDIADFAVGQSRMLYGKTMHSERPQHRMYEQWHPIGPVGVISAFNFPVAVWSWNAFIAAICGNTTIWKPSSQTPLCAIAVQHICNEVLKANDAPGIFSLVIGGGSSIGETLINDKDVPLISFTGSTRMGKHVDEVVSSRFGKTILELGGNNCIIVDETADMGMVVPAVVFGAVGTAGQRCTSTRRVIVHENIFDNLLDKIISAYKQVNIGDPLSDNTLMGPLVNKNAVNDHFTAIDRAVKQGGKLHCGGNEILGKGTFVEPAIIEAENDWDIVQEETFTPILYVMKYKKISQAIRMHNDVPQGLSSAMFTLNIKNAESFLSSVGSDCGIANINIGTSGAEIGGAFGGEKETGGGRESGSDSWKQYMRRQTNTINWGSDLLLAQGIEFNIKD
ncbi:MAG: aldehyde dehydrogenase family protein [Candidatus Marinimicrobia bacterium]|nr:aldehyde dehydrogenase family protein [Candidatus Neomarinimicrobiota bacterium]